MNFWKEILREKKMILGLSPMDGVTDAAFRWIVAKYGKPDVMYTEFVNVEGLIRGNVEKLLPILMYHQSERPIIAQLFGKTPVDFYRATVLVAELGFDGIDINMGCPVRRVAEKGSGAGLIKTPDLAQEIVRQTKEAVEDWSKGRVGLEEVMAKQRWLKAVREFKQKLQELGVEFSKKRKLPVSVKTRLGIDEDVSQWWMKVLSEVKPAEITLHGRTLKQMYSGQADWEAIGRAGEMVKKEGIVFLGNGDVKSVDEAREKVEGYGVDGVLIGRASFGNPWIFKDTKLDLKEKLKVMIEHAEKYEELFGEGRFLPMRKHLAWYAKGFEGAKELRKKLVLANSAKDCRLLVEEVSTF